jgi:hypothetical protein
MITEREIRLSQAPYFPSDPEPQPSIPWLLILASLGGLAFCGMAYAAFRALEIVLG